MSGGRPYNRGGRGWRGRGWSFRGRWRGGSQGRGRAKNTPSVPGTPNRELETYVRREEVSSQSSQRLITSMLPPVNCPYKGWTLYMPEGYAEGSETVVFIKAFDSYIKTIRRTMQKSDIEEKHFFKVDVQHLIENEDVLTVIPELAQLIINSPQRIINCLGLALYQIIYEEVASELRENTLAVLEETVDGSIDPETIDASIPEVNLPIIRARLYNLPKLTLLKNLKANYYGKLVSLRSTVVRVGNIKPLCTFLAFTCLGCDGVLSIQQPEGKYTVPNSCPVDNCRSRSFQALLTNELTQTVDWQSIKLQEIISDDQREGGRVPRTVECELLEDLVDTCVPGDMITVTGIVKVSHSDEGRGGKGDKCMFQLYLDAVSVVNCKAGTESSSNNGIEFSIKDYYAIQEIQGEPQLFKLLVGSLCPAIYGHEMVKAGLLLCMFGGTSRCTGDQPPIRSDPHILVVGDPGLGKSQMLQACVNVAPRGVYVCGNTTTTSGLTVTLTREAGTGDYALEGGALVLGDQGVCCIDEFDKMPSQHQALLEAMEQQCISIAKAGIVCSLPARTSILAAANPVGGHYNKAKTVSENLKMNSALLSRFDLVFILLDKPDEELDCLLSEHVMALHSGIGRKRAFAVRGGLTSQDLNTPSKSLIDKPLGDRLKYYNEEYDPIPHELIRKYICYARKYVHPKLSTEASGVLQEFYLHLRQKHQSCDSTPITTRQLESLIRLSQARAKCELREIVTEQDALDVIEIMKSSMVDTYSDEFGFLDFQRSQHGSGSSNRGQMKKFIAALQKISDNTYKSIFNVSEMRQLAKEIHIQVRDFGEFIASLNHQGYLLKKGNKSYQLLTANC